MHDAARFLPDDHEALVAASFACPVCLRRPSYARLSAHHDVPAASCACLPCARGWEVGLSGAQMLRLTLAPPAGLVLDRAEALSQP